MEDGDLSINIKDKSYTIPLDSTAYATLNIVSESLVCEPTFQFQLTNGGAVMNMGVSCPFNLSISAFLDIQTKIAVKKTKTLIKSRPIPFPLPILGPLSALGRVEISIEFEVSVAASVAVTLEGSLSLSGTAQASVQLPSPGLSESFNVDPIQVSFTQNGEICDATADISISIVKLTYFPLAPNWIFNPEVSLSLARHFWFDALTPPPAEPVHDLHFFPCPCPDNALCPSLVATSEGGTLSSAADMEFFGLITANLFDKDLKFFDQKILSQSCGMLPCSPRYICNKSSAVSPPYCEPTDQPDAAYYSQCKETCIMRYSCDETFKCVQNVNGTYSTPEECSHSCKPPPWYGCPCGTGTICCACPNAPYPCTGACFLGNEIGRAHV